MEKSKRILILLGLAGLLLRFALSAISVGTNDIITWQRFAENIDKIGLAELYHADHLFNHPPLAGLAAWLLWKLAEFLALPFPFVFRLPGILADGFTGLLLYSIVRRKATWRLAAISFCLFCWNPANFLISGFHGNTDPIYACLVLLSLFFIEEKGRYLFAGLALAAAVNVKIIPVLLLLPILGSCSSRRSAGTFVLGFSVGTLPFVVGFALAGKDMLSNIFLYNSFVEVWGITLVLEAVSAVLHLGQSLILFYHAYGRYLLLFSLAAFSLLVFFRRGRFSRYTIATVTFLLFLLLAPGIGVQYFAILPPLLFAATIPWAFRMSLATGIFVLLAYSSSVICWFPLEYRYAPWPPYVYVSGLALWYCFILGLRRLLKMNAARLSEDVPVSVEG